MSEYKTEQEAFWAGQFGDEYIGRNQGPHWLASNLALFVRALKAAAGIDSILELGANIGNNLQTLHQLLPQASLHAVEINAQACAEMRKLGYIEVTQASLLSYAPAHSFALTFTKGVLIHIEPQALAEAYRRLYESSRRYILLAEYYNPTPVEVSYRGHANRLFKRDFAGEMIERYADLRLLDYGFVYRRDPSWPQDDLTWFLLEKRR